MKITLQDVQRGYDDWAAQPHNKKWVRKIDGTPIANDIVVRIFDALSQAEPTPHPSDAERHERAVQVAWQYFCDDEWRHSTAPERHREIGYPMRPLYVSPPATVQEPVADTGPWCQPRYDGRDHPRKFMVVYEDADMGSALFEDETEARNHFEAASIAWNCYLFGLLPRSALSTSQSDPAPEIVHSSIVDQLDRVTDALEVRFTEIAALRADNERLREALQPFANAARNFAFAIAPDGIDDGLAVIAAVHGRPEREAVLTTMDFSRAAASISNDPCFSITAGIGAVSVRPAVAPQQEEAK